LTSILAKSFIDRGGPSLSSFLWLRGIGTRASSLCMEIKEKWLGLALFLH